MADPDPEALLELANYRMPFGKHQGARLVELPEEYLIWFSRKGFPRGKLGALMASALDIKTNGLEHLLEPLYEPDGREGETDRTRLLRAAKWFVEQASQLESVLQISLMGSICTPKRRVKDVDLLVKLVHGSDLGALAKCARGLQGKIQRGRLGADVFLVEDGRYIGRACRYREPWLRQACAQGNDFCSTERPFLCDTSAHLKLSGAAIETPPVVLWPEVKLRGPVPDDVMDAFGLERYRERELF